MTIVAWIVGGIYLAGLLGVFALEASIGPVTLGLAACRAVVWPYYIATGKPKGQRLPMD